MPAEPRAAVKHLAKWTHYISHQGTRASAKQILKCWYEPGIQEADAKVIQSCAICMQRNVSRAVKTERSFLPWVRGPFQHVQIDYADMPMSIGNCHILLVVTVDGQKLMQPDVQMLSH